MVLKALQKSEDHTKKAAAQIELNLYWDIKGNKKDFNQW